MKGKIAYAFSAPIWPYQGKGGWHFVSLPGPVSAEIRTHMKWMEEGWGRLRAMAQIGDTIWETAIWFDAKRSTYLLPVKASVRSALCLAPGQEVQVNVWI